jgi:hypothetical protein
MVGFFQDADYPLQSIPAALAENSVAGENPGCSVIDAMSFGVSTATSRLRKKRQVLIFFYNFCRQSWPYL